MSFIKKNKAFTLIELLVVIAIISILTSIVLSNLSTPKAKARDAKRISDISQLQLALEMFFDRCGLYPVVSSDLPKIDDVCNSGTVHLYDFISQIPPAPNQTTGYKYSVISPGSPSSYILKATLEISNSNLDNYTGSILNYTPSITCGGGVEYCVVPK